MRVILHALLPWFLFLAAGGCKTRGEAETIWIGHVAPLSGPNSRIGEQSRQAILLAVEEANKDENRIAGHRIAVLHVDSRDDENVLQPEAIRLITFNRVVALLGGMDPVQVERLGRAAQPYDVPLVTPAAVAADRLVENVFSVNTSLGFQAQVLARFAAMDLKAKQIVALIDSRRTFNTTVAEAFNKEFSKLGGQGVQHAYKSEAELAKAVSMSPDAKPQAVLYAGAADDLAKARALLQGAGMAVPLLFAGDLEGLATLEADAKTNNGVFLVTPYVREGDAAEIQQFIDKYRDRFHEIPTTDALLAYDGVRVLIQAMHKSESTITRKAAVLAGFVRLMNEGFDSLGGRISFNKDHSARRPLFVVRLENGKMEDARRFDSQGK